MLRTFATRQEVRKNGPNRHKRGYGYLYILESRTMVKVGYSAEPRSRVYFQKRIGAHRTWEPVKKIHVSRASAKAREHEQFLHLACCYGRRFYGRNGAREVYPRFMLRYILPLMKALMAGRGVQEQSERATFAGQRHFFSNRAALQRAKLNAA